MQPKTCPKLAGGGSWAKRVVLAQGRQLARVVEVALERRSPTALHRLDLPREPLCLVAAGLCPARGGFVVAELGKGGPQVQVPGANELEAKIDIVERDRQLLVEPADLLIDRAPRHQALPGAATARREGTHRRRAGGLHPGHLDPLRRRPRQGARHEWYLEEPGEPALRGDRRAREGVPRPHD